ncbi:molybdopterin converting factor [Rubinisphaera sp.]|uniref:molybdopterin converting factor n=1 Tax=Rubinisphaera sp. TaxID=2024857 RepID=UPI0025DADFE1|nr:molybdopterin converting factor [Rubinisphaera sp.]
MKILYINNDGGGFADYITIEPETTISHFVDQRLKHGIAADYLIRVNRQPVSSDYLLQAGDRVSLTPTKIEGALEECFGQSHGRRETQRVQFAPAGR